MSTRSLIWIFATLAVFALVLTAQDQPQTAQPKTVIKHVPIKQTSPASGQEMFTSYCAACHGKPTVARRPQ